MRRKLLGVLLLGVMIVVSACNSNEDNMNKMDTEMNENMSNTEDEMMKDDNGKEEMVEDEMMKDDKGKEDMVEDEMTKDDKMVE